MMLHWWQIIISLFCAFLSGFCAFLSGYAFGLASKETIAYHRGRRDIANEIEKLSGMHDAICTCVSTPGECVYHGNLTKGVKRIEIKDYSE